MSLSNASLCWVELSWPRFDSTALIGTIFDLYNDSAKANGMVRSFRMSHPTDGHTYVIRFDSDLTREYQIGSISGIVNCRFRVLGNIAD